MAAKKKRKYPTLEEAYPDMLIFPDYLCPVINAHECPMLGPYVGWFTVMNTTLAMNDEFDAAMAWRRYEGARHGT
jgi:hypothetical protein